jgi:glycosyltransferase involved in cell wall biosynthesis
VRSIAIISNQAFAIVNFRGPLIRDLLARGVEVYALAPDYDDALRAKVASLGAQPVDFSLSRTGLNPVRDLQDTVRLRSVLRRLAPDASLANYVKPVIYGSLAAWAARIPARYSMIEGLGYVFIEDGRPPSLRRRALRYLVSRLYRCALSTNRRVFFLNPDDLGQFLASNVVRPQQTAQINGIGLDLEYYSPVPPVLEPVTFLFVARMLREKGVYDFVDAARTVKRRFSNARFLLVGSTDPNPGSVSTAVLESWVREGLVEWAGQVPDVRPWIARASVFVLPSYREGLPRSSQEAMAMGRPVITTDCAGCRETVVDGVNGYLVPVRRPDALAAAMMRFIDTPSLIQEMGRESRRIATERFDVREINRQILEILELGLRASRT